jgi:hypothetical protein
MVMRQRYFPNGNHTQRKSYDTDSNTCFPHRAFSMLASGSAVQVKGLGVLIGFGEEAVDGGLEIDDALMPLNTARLIRCRVSLAKKPSTALSQDAQAGDIMSEQRAT